MLVISIPEMEFFDEENERFITQKAVTLRLEHSLASVSKWESRWHKPFLSTEFSTEEFIDYIWCMSMEEVPLSVLSFLSDNVICRIKNYINDPMTASTFNNASTDKSGRKEVITAEIIYYWLTALNIPFECENWHLNRLMALIRVCGIKNTPKKKRKGRDVMNDYRSLNKARRAKYGSGG